MTYIVSAVPYSRSRDASEGTRPSLHSRSRHATGWLAPWLGRARLAILGRRPVLARLGCDLAEAAQRIRALAHSTEPDFLNLTAALNSLYEAATKLSRSIAERIESVRDTVGRGSLSGEDGLVVRSARELKDALARAADDVESLAAIAGSLEQLRRQGERIDRIARVLRASSCNFAVESARSAATQSAFGAFVEELRGLAARIGQVGDTITDRAESTSVELHRLLQTLKGDVACLSDLTHASEDTVLRASDEIQQLFDRSLAVLQQAAEHTRAIERHASEAVFYMQFGDIVRQKLEHVADALASAADLCASTETTGTIETRLDGILAIQGGQLEEIHGEIDAGRDQLLSAFSGLSAQTSELLTDVRRLGEDGFSCDSRQDRFSVLERDLLQLEDLQTRGRGLSSQARTTARRAAEASHELNSHVDQVHAINRAMHLQALNAIVKTVLLGDEGDTLGVLSAGMHTVFQESNSVVVETVKVLERASRATTLATADAGIASDSEESPLHACLDELRGACASLHDVAESASAHADAQPSRLAAIRTQLEFLNALAAEARHVSGELAHARASLRPRRTAPAGSAELVSMLAGYTMESERQVFRRVTAGAAAAPVPAPAAAGDALGDNAELF